MDPVIIPVGAAITMAVFVLLSVTVGRKAMKSDDVPQLSWRESISGRGFRQEAAQPGERERWVGRIEHWDAAVVVRRTGDTAMVEASVVIPGLDGVDFSLGAFAGVGFSVMTDGFRTGDDAFDSLVTVGGSERVAPAFLGRAVRDAVRECLVYSLFRVEGGRVSAAQIGPDFNDDIWPIQQRLVALARALGSTEADIEGRLARLATDPDEPMRLRERCARILFESHANSGAARRVAAQLAQQPIDAELRLLACSTLVADDDQPLRAFVLAPQTQASLRTRALGILHAHGKADDALIEQLVRRADALTTAAAIEIVINERRKHLVEPLRVAAADPPRGGGAAARALAAFDDFGGAPVLVRALADIDDSLAMPYVQALEKLGQIDAVAALRAIRVGFGQGEIRAAIETAVRAIQERAGRPDAGRLTVVEDAAERGNLSVIDES